jgi:hypothetical protein
MSGIKYKSRYLIRAGLQEWPSNGVPAVAGPELTADKAAD